MGMTKRFERMERHGVRLTERDLQVVESVFEARYLTNQMVARLFFSPTTFSWCKQRLRYLYDLGYLKKRHAYPNEPDIYFLGLKGRQHVASVHNDYTREEADRIAGVAGDEAAPMLMMKHELTLSRLYVSARYECAQYDWTFLWRNTRMLELLKLGFEPDAWFEIRNGARSKQTFMEFTAVMPPEGELAAKIERYEAYWERTHTPTGVLWFTTSSNKLSQIRDIVRTATYKDYFLLGLIDEAGPFLTKKMWWWSESEEMIQWIKPPR
ncbi:MAG: replication-relaxation family protein [Armatimonadota bacterium]